MHGVVRPRPDPRPGGGLRPRVSRAGSSTWVTRSSGCAASPTARSCPRRPATTAMTRRRRTRTSPGWRRPASTPSASTRCRRAWLLDAAQAARTLGRGGHPLGGARHLPGPEAAAGSDPRPRGRGRAQLRRPPGHPGLQHRQRDPVAHRALARRAARWRTSWSASPTPSARRTPVRSSRTSTTRPPSTCASAASTTSPGTSTWRMTQDFERYVARLQNLAPDRPVVIAELGADSLRKGADFQADAALDGRCARPSRPAGRARSCSPGRTSGPAAAWPWRTGTSG